MKIEAKNRLLASDPDADFEKWQQEVKEAYPEYAAKIKFKARIEDGKDTVSAEVPGQDRSFGVWDNDTFTGTVL